MRSTSGWFDKATSIFLAVSRQCRVMVAVAALALGWATTAAGWDDVMATGQTTCYGSVQLADGSWDADVIPCQGTGQDGEFQKGTKSRYTDLRNGVIESNTGLQWEKKSCDGSIHDMDNTYTWADAFQHVATLNSTCEGRGVIQCSTNTQCQEAGAGRCGYAGKRDWRLPNVRELQTLVNFGVFSTGVVLDDGSVAATPTVSPEFHTNCPLETDENGVRMCEGRTVLMASCSVDFTYWTSTTGDIPADAWFVDFGTGDTGAHTKVIPDNPDCPGCAAIGIDFQADQGGVIFAGHVRAVRGGE